MRADPYSTLANVLQSFVDLGWPIAGAFALAAIAITIYGRDHA